MIYIHKKPSEDCRYLTSRNEVSTSLVSATCPKGAGRRVSIVYISSVYIISINNRHYISPPYYCGKKILKIV